MLIKRQRVAEWTKTQPTWMLITRNSFQIQVKGWGASLVAQWLKKKKKERKKSPRANTGDVTLSPDPGRSHTLHNQAHCWACALEPGQPQLLSAPAAMTETHVPQGLCPQPEKPPQWEAHTPQLESSLHSPQLEKSLYSNKDPAQPEINKQIKVYKVEGWGKI